MKTNENKNMADTGEDKLPLGVSTSNLKQETLYDLTFSVV